MDNKFWRKENSDASSTDDCSNHKKEIAGISDMKVLAEQIGDLHYETLAELFKRLGDKLWADCAKDLEAGRQLLSEELGAASAELFNAAYHISEAWIISKPFMTTDKQ